MPREYVNRKFLCREYIEKQKSLRQLRQEYGWGINTIKRWLKYHNISIRGHDSPIVTAQKTGALDKNPRWKGQQRNNGYIYVYFPEHPNAGKAGYVSEHRLIASKILGRPLTKLDIIHHIDGDRTNNAEDNLFITVMGGHRKAHGSLMAIGYKLFKNGKLSFKDGEYKWM